MWLSADECLAFDSQDLHYLRYLGHCDCLDPFCIDGDRGFMEPAFDDDDPRLDDLVGQISDAESAFSSEGTDPVVLDLKSLNAGDWLTACVFGAYSNPSVEMAKLGAITNPRDRNRLKQAKTRGFRAAEVEETEAMITYIDAQNNAHFLHLRGGFGQYSEFGKQCISKPQTTVTLR